MPIHTHKTEETNTTSALAPTIAIHDHNGEKYCSLVLKGELHRVTPDDPRVAATEKAWAAIYRNPEYYGVESAVITAHSLGLTAKENQEFHGVLQVGDIQKFLFETIPNRRRGIVDLRTVIEFDWSKDPNALIGERWLCKGKQAIIQGPTGVGKSSLISQWAICLIFGLPFFGIKAKRKMRVLIIQAENDDGDLGQALQDMFAAMKLTEEQINFILENIRFVTEEKVSGASFSNKLRQEIYSFRPDIVFADPLLHYAGCDLMNQKEMSFFMRHIVPPVLSDTGALLIWVHHVSKQGERGGANREPSNESKKYSGLGSSDIQNVCRETITLSEMGDGLFELNFGKRYRRLGIRDSDGNPIRKFNIQHAKNGIVWEKAEGVKATVDKKGAAGVGKLETVHRKIQAEKRITKDELKAWAQLNGIGQNDVITLANSIVATHEKIKPPIGTRIFQYKPEPEVIPGQKSKGGRPKEVYTITPPAWFKPQEEVAEPELNEDIFGAPTENASNEKAEGPDPNKNYVIPCEGSHDQNYRCTFCDRDAGGSNEGIDTPVGKTEEYCRMTMSQGGDEYGPCPHADKCAALCGYKFMPSDG
jgi:hypothetical protein